MTRRLGMAMFAAMLGLSRVVWAAALLQTPIMFTNGTDHIYCIATNVGTTPIASVTVSNVDQTNTTVNTFTCPSVAPGGLCDAFTTTSSRCTISFTGSKKNIRALVSVVDAANNMKATIPAN
jgi:hypothetical protein